MLNKGGDSYAKVPTYLLYVVTCVDEGRQQTSWSRGDEAGMSLAHPTLKMGVSGERDDFGIF